MDSVIDKKIKVPLHYQIYLDLLKKIQSGVLKTGDKIPSEPELERIYGVSRVTVRGAVEMLAQEGLVEKNRGKKGTIVCKSKHAYDMKKLTSFTDDVKLYGENASSELLDFKEMVPDQKVAQSLELKAGETVYYVERKRYREGVVVGLHKSYIKRLPSLELKAGQFGPDVSLYAILKSGGIIPTTATELLEVKVPSSRILEVLGLVARTAVFYKERVTYSGDRIPFEYVEMFYNPEYYKYKVELQLD
ncbi:MULTISPECIES: GntR family transcriptional regulator [Lacrimispora]|jgi:GntR family transcriptional regulator|uniref:GntR family transcriptional regulator n=1 Tax=Lacrimispora sphenoides JCM 1415 TaxID=1297793 RepID=A0ABY1C577_9FIRM|nr:MULTISPECIES: GntR family transcriptional regulator [Lacrimispora]MDR7813762.1 GntR family transcriptional regulator [Lacrimispora sp.]SET67645.1 GntR family transcriptional regulator [[Clostridium] sphenoides JCM 1415]SEU27140.1 GntR family transcriptional regulator [Lacrimispora sphenoides]SUY50422.1 transcriptional regulator, GntR family [Lacrimispora sphenoides]